MKGSLSADGMADIAVMEAMALKEPMLINQTDSWQRTALYLLTYTYSPR